MDVQDTDPLAIPALEHTVGSAGAINGPSLQQLQPLPLLFPAPIPSFSLVLILRGLLNKHPASSTPLNGAKRMHLHELTAFSLRP